MQNNNKCPICGGKFTNHNPINTYHISYKPEITTEACRGCNFAEKLIQHPELEMKLNPFKRYFMKKRIKKVKEWTIKNRPLIS